MTSPAVLTTADRVACIIASPVTTTCGATVYPDPELRTVTLLNISL